MSIVDSTAGGLRSGVLLSHVWTVSRTATQLAKSQRVAPWGSADATPKAVCSVRRYRCQGAGPALGALYGAVNASPATVAGQPPDAVDGRDPLQGGRSR